MVTLDRSKPIARFDGLTALELDQQGYAYYPTTYPITMTDGVGYTSAQYGLASAVDATSFDPAKGDLFAGLDASLLGPTAEPYVAPSPTPQASEPAADTAAIAAATPVTTAETAQAETAPSNTTDIPNTALLIGCAAAGVLALIGAVLLKKGTRLKIVAIIVCGVFLLGAIFFAVRYFQHKPDDASASEPQDAAAKLAPTPMPSDSMEPTAEPEPTPTPDPWDPYFRSASDPEEVVVIDLEMSTGNIVQIRFRSSSTACISRNPIRNRSRIASRIFACAARTLSWRVFETTIRWSSLLWNTPGIWRAVIARYSASRATT